MEIKGDKELWAKLGRFAVAMPKQARAAVYQEAIPVANDSKIHTPLEFGPLRNSTKIIMSGPGEEIVATISVGDTSTTYAVPVHERLDLKHDPPTGPKFLENAVRNAAKGLAERLGKRLNVEKFSV